MRIALDCRSAFPGRGGIGRYAESLARALARLDGKHDYLILVTGRQTEQIVRDGRAKQITVQAAMIDQVWEQLQLPMVLEEHGVDLYHNPCFSLPVVKTTRWRVATVHDVVFRSHPDLVAPGLRDYLDHWSEHSLDAADAIITATEFSKQDIIGAYGTPGEKIHVIPHGVEERFRKQNSGGSAAGLRKKYKLPKRFVLYVGAIEAKKNIERLLEAFSLLVKDGDVGDRKLVLAGGQGGKGYDIDSAIGRNDLREHVIVTGYIDDKDMVGLMNLAGLFVYPSLHEGFGLPPLEAMACGTPTVVSDATCLPEVVGDGALVAPAEDAPGLAEQMAKGLKDKNLRRSLMRRGRRRSKEFTWERTAQRTLDLYESVAGGVA